MTINIMQVSKSQPITVRGGVWDDDIFDQDWCNHDGAKIEEVTSSEFDNDSGQYAQTGTELMLVCDKCEATLVGDEWVEA